MAAAHTYKVIGCRCWGSWCYRCWGWWLVLPPSLGTMMVMDVFTTCQLLSNSLPEARYSFALFVSEKVPPEISIVAFSAFVKEASKLPPSILISSSLTSSSYRP